MYKTVTFEKLKVACSETLSNTVLDGLELLDPKLEMFSDPFVNGLIARLSAFVLATPKLTVDRVYPDTWWDHFKETYFPEWLKKRFPVKYKKAVFQYREIFPDIGNDQVIMAAKKTNARYIDMLEFKGFGAFHK